MPIAHQRGQTRPAHKRGQTRPAHKRGQTRPARKRGQTLVEYILVLAVVVGGITVFKDTLLQPLLSVLTMTTQAVRVEATRGGKRDIQGYYAGSCSGTDTKGCK